MPAARKPTPKKYWYAVASVLTAVGLIVCGVGIGMIVNSVGMQPTSEHTFGAGGSTTVHIDAGETKVVYVANATAAGGHRVHCDTIGGDSGSVQMNRYRGSLTLNQWDATFTVTPSTTADYTIRCTGAASDTFRRRR
jgi:preprotein translocase subunit Sss1